MVQFSKWFILFFTAILLTSCDQSEIDTGSELVDGSELDNSSELDERFGVIANKQMPIKNWSALLHMDQYGSIEFCIRNTRNTSEKQMVEQDAIRAVNEWLDLMKRGAPDSSYPAWRRSRVDVSFGCGNGSYTIAMFEGRSNCEYWNRKINLGYGYESRKYVLTHEFGHSMGLADTYSYSGGTIKYQPDSMMQSAQRFTDDDYKGIWALWNYIKTGDMRCGPGYVQATKVNTAYDELCKPGSSQDQNQDQGTCTDTNSNCSSWASRGYCTGQYESYMKTNCCKSCKGTSDNNNNDTCRDTDGNCASWANKGYCSDSRYRDWMQSNCCQSCKGSSNNNTTTTTTCKDLNSQCAAWASRGECSRNPGYMEVYCKKSCGICR